MWNDLVQMGVSAPEKIVRTALVYLALAVLLRLGGKRDLAQLNTFDLVVMLLLSNVVQNAVIGPDNSVAGGVIGAVTLLAVNAGVNRLVHTSDRAARVIEGTDTVLAHDGAWDEEALDREGLRLADAEAAVRRQNATDIKDVQTVTLDHGGTLVVTLRSAAQPATRGDLERLEAKLDRLLAPPAPPAPPADPR